MEGRSAVVVIAAAAALGLAGYAVYTTLAPDPPPPEAANSPASDAPRAARPTKAPPNTAKGVKPGRRAQRSATKATAKTADDDLHANPNRPTPRDAFDYSRERYDSAAQMLRKGDRDARDTRALMEQARLAVKDMDALLDADQPAHRRALNRATEDLIRLESRFGE